MSDVKKLMDYLKKGIKLDGRKLDEFRKIELETSISETSEGSARVRIGETEVLAGVKMLIDKPYPDTPEEGCLMTGVELLPLSSPDFEGGPPDQHSIELARVIDRGIRESKAIDMKQLCIEKGEKVWMISIDIVTVNDDGNLMDAGALAAVAALEDTRFPGFDGTTVDYREKTDKKLPMTKQPIAVTVFKIGNSFFVDPCIEEEKVIEARLTVASTQDETICALQKGGDHPLSIEDISKMVDLGIAKAKEIRQNLKVGR